jgi:hypothetical protein
VPKTFHFRQIELVAIEPELIVLRACVAQHSSLPGAHGSSLLFPSVDKNLEESARVFRGGLIAGNKKPAVRPVRCAMKS